MPQLVKEDAMYITGFLPNDAMNLYRVNPASGHEKQKERVDKFSQIVKKMDDVFRSDVRNKSLQDLVDADNDFASSDLKRWFDKYNNDFLSENESSTDPLPLDQCTYNLLQAWHSNSQNEYAHRMINTPREEDDLWLIGTSEVPLVAQHMNEILDVSELPLRYCGFSSCYRREAGTYGKDTKGLIRVHQFEKVEMVSFCKPEDSVREHEHLREVEEEIFTELGIHFQRLLICSGDLGAPAAKKYDLEAWFPGMGVYKEVTSTSNTTDFQTRRGNIKFKDGERKEFVHSLNGTALALGRALAAIVETYQTKEGDIVVPEVLRKRMGEEKI